MRRVQFWVNAENVESAKAMLPDKCQVVEVLTTPSNMQLMIVEGEIFPEEQYPWQVYPLLYRINNEIYWDFQLEGLRWVKGKKEVQDERRPV